MAKPNFNCSQSVFVLAVETIFNSMEEFLADFTAFRPKYILAWINAGRTALAAADALPDEDARNAASTVLRVELSVLNANCCALWQKLARYIKGAYPANVVQIQLNAAGHAKYDSAFHSNWADAKAMLTSANNFLTTNLATLTADGNMSATFATEFGDARDLFNAKLTEYEDSKEVVYYATQAKVEAFNEVYDTVRPVMDDGQEIFRDNEAVRTQFVFADVTGRISGPGLAGARGTVTNSLDFLPIQGALATLKLASNPAIVYTTITDADGKYLINCPSGDYQLGFTADTYAPSTIKDIGVAVGTVSTFNESLTPVGG